MRDTDLTQEAHDYRGIRDRGISERGLTQAVQDSEAAARPKGEQAAEQVVGWFEEYAKGYTGETIDDTAWEAAANDLDCEIAAIKAIATVESGALGAYWKAGWPIILYEKHRFSSQTGRKFDQQHPDISSKTGYRFPNKSERKKALTDELYAWTQDANYVRLGKAYSLDKVAALKSASWGKFQILGENHVAAGFPASVEDYVRAVCASEKEQLRSFVNFLKADARLLKALRAKNWADFAKVYNGKEYKKFNYDTRMQAAYEKEASSKETPAG